MTSPLSRISTGSFFSGVMLRIFVIGLARHDGGRHEFDLVDQAEFDRGDAHLAGEWRGGGEGEFHLDCSLRMFVSVMAGACAEQSTSFVLAHEQDVDAPGQARRMTS